MTVPTPTGPARRLAAETLGMLLLTATVVGSGIMATRLGDDLALALLANSLATGAVLFVLITLFAPISGAHFNPAVTLVAALRREIGWREAVLFVAAQIAGGVLGTILAHLMFEAPVLSLGAHARTGAAQWLSEAVASFGLVLTILVASRHRPQSIAALVGCYIMAAYWFTASTSFANPAITIARALTDSFAGIRPVDAMPFILAQLAGALLALALCRWLLEDKPT
jgi:glycerol uptake facilitator-like aquaporin